MESLSITPDTPAGTPPAGVTPNFINPPSKQTGIIVLEAVFMPLMLIAVAGRVWVRTRIVKLWGPEDTTCLLAACGSIAHMILYTQTFPIGLGRHMWDIRAIWLLEPSNTRLFSGNGITFPWTLGFAKISILLLYKRLFPLHREIFAVWIGIIGDAVLYLTCIGVAIASIVKCAELGDASTSFCRFNSGPMVIFVSVVNVVTDFYVLILPVARLIHLQVSRKRKMGLVLVFASGLGACAASLARLINFALNYHNSDTFWIQGLNAQFSVAEMNIAIIVACASTLPLFFARVRALSSTIIQSAVSLLRTTRGGTTAGGLDSTTSNKSPTRQGWQRSRNGRRTPKQDTEETGVELTEGHAV